MHALNHSRGLDVVETPASVKRARGEEIAAGLERQARDLCLVMLEDRGLLLYG